MILMLEIVQEIGEEKIGGGKVHLNVKEIAGDPGAVDVLSFWKAGDETPVVLAVGAVGEPGAPFLDGAGEARTGRPVARMEATPLRVEAGNEMGRSVVERVC
jgi:hypothetical protein